MPADPDQDSPRSVRVEVERPAAGGDGIGRLDDGRIVFVAGALPGELVEAAIVDERRDFARARTTEVVRASPDRVELPCPHRRAGCGGCGWMHLRPGAQLDAKAEIVADCLRRIGRLDEADVARLVQLGSSVAPVGARTTLRLVGDPDGRPALREEGSDRPVPIDSCPVAHPNLVALLPELRIEPGVELSLRTSVSTGAVTAYWRRPGRRRRGRRDERPSGQAFTGLPRHVHVGERAFLVERVAGVDLRVSAASFFQSGPQAADLLAAAVRAAAPELADARHAVDAYGGIGMFAATAMATADHVTVIESSARAIDDAAVNLEERGPSATIVASEVGRWDAPAAAARRPVDVVVADPARPGLGRPGVAAVTATSAPVVVLVSCDPASLARDAVLLAESGYVAERVDVFDPFPQTAHVETVTRFTRSLP